MTYLNKINNQPDLYLSSQPIDCEPLESIQHLITKIEKVITNCLEPLFKLFEQLKTIFDLTNLDKTLSFKDAYEILDWSHYLLSDDALKENWGGSAPTSENRLSHSHVMKVSDQAVIIERKELGKGGGKLVNTGILLKINHLAQAEIQQVAVLRPLFKMELDNIILDEKNVRALQLDHNHIEAQALYTGKTFDPALLKHHQRDPDISLINQYMIKPYLKPFDQLKTTKDGLQGMLDIAKSISYLHRRDFVHRDIKPDNMMYTDKQNNKISAKLIDLGQLHRIDNESDNVFLGTEGYLAPEIEQSTIHTKASDMFAFGVSLHKVIDGLNKNDHAETLLKIEALANKLIQETADARPSATDAYNELKAIKLAF